MFARCLDTAGTFTPNSRAMFFCGIQNVRRQYVTSTGTFTPLAR